MISAVSVILKYNDRVLLVKRQNFLKAFPGYHAFIGGKVDLEDIPKTSDDFSIKRFVKHHDTKRNELLNALYREVKEETSIDLVELDNLGLIKEMSYLGLAETPDFNPYRFATYFYLVELLVLPKIKLDLNELSLFEFKHPSYFLDSYIRGDLLVVPPILNLLNHLNNGEVIEKKLDFDFRYNSKTSVPMIESIYGLKQLMPLSNTLFPADRTNSFLIEKTLVDPSPKNLEEYKRFKNTINEFKVDKIFLTHHHGDHREFSNQLALELNIPIYLSEQCFKLIYQSHKNFFNQVDYVFIKEGDVVCRWNDKSVKAFDVSGHANGHLALYSECKTWMIVGDLIQGIGTVVVSKKDGNMKNYLLSLKKVIDFAPNVIIPSHGIAMGGTHYIESTLAHRKKRHDQISLLYKNGSSILEILDKVYMGLDDRLKKYATENIESHLEMYHAETN